MTYTRAHLRDALTSRFKIDRKLAADLIEEVLVQIAEQAMKGNKVELRGFGMFEAVTRAQKIGRNPRKPEAGDYIIPARRTIRFRVGRILDEVLNQEPEPEAQTPA